MPFDNFATPPKQCIPREPNDGHMSRSTPPPSSSEDGKPDVDGEKAYSQEPPTGSSLPDDGILQKSKLSEDSTSVIEEKAADKPAPPPITYPKGIQLVGIMASLVLAIGLMSLDSASFIALVL